MDKTNLPPLPEYAGTFHVQHFRDCPSMRNVEFAESADFATGSHRLYTAEQMREYAARAVREAVAEIRAAVADYMGSEGCRCCEGDDHDDHEARLAELLSVPKYDDDSGYDFGKFRTVAPTPDQEPTP